LTSTRIALVAAVVAALAVTPAALAGKGGGGSGSGGTTTGTSTLSVVNLYGATEPHYNGFITFNVSTTQTDRPYVGLRCYQGSTWVYDGYVGYFPTYMFAQEFQLASQTWVGGAADCTARLFSYTSRGRETLYKTMTFTVAA